VNPNQKEIAAGSGFPEKVDVAIMKKVSNGVHIYAHDYPLLKVKKRLS
jgi:hypothetical protein